VSYTTKERWSAASHEAGSDHGEEAHTLWPQGAIVALPEGDTERLVRCVNACHGLRDPEQAILVAKATLRTLMHRFKTNPAGDQLGQADGEMIADAIRLLGLDP
jgi:hypothetical protein